MSRFFELLSERSRSDQGVNGVECLESPTRSLRTRTPSTISGMDRALSASLSRELEHSPDAGPGRPEDVVRAEEIRNTEAEVTIKADARLIPQALNKAVTEHYRRLRTKILQQQKARGFRTLLVTSANPQEGKTLTVLNLGLSFAMLPSFKVLVLDGDLRRSSFGEILGIHGRPGFSNLIDGSAQLGDVVMKCDKFPLYFVVSGTSPVPAGELLQSDELGKQLRSMAERFSLVLVDSPPVNLLTDTHLLASDCDSVLLVARAFRSKRKSVEKAIQDLAPFPVIGAVLNGGASATPYGSGKYYY